MRLAPSKVLVYVTCLLLTGCGPHAAGATAPSATSTDGPAITHANETTAVANAPSASQDWPVTGVRLMNQIPQGVVGNALVMNRKGTLFSIGGYTGAYSTAGVYAIHSAGPSRTAELPERSHDMAAGFLGDDLYVFGGGQSDSYDSIVRIHSNDGNGQVIGHLTAPLSDAVCVPYHWGTEQGLLLIGGYDGQVYRKTAQFITLHDGNLMFRNAFTLPVGVRYPAVAVRGNAVYIVGGKTAQGLSNAVYRWVPSSPVATKVGVLPQGVEKGAGYATDEYVVVVGGLHGQGRPSAAIIAMQTATGKTKQIGSLPRPLGDMGYVASGGHLYIAGGMKTSQVANTSTKVYQIDFLRG